VHNTQSRLCWVLEINFVLQHWNSLTSLLQLPNALWEAIAIFMMEMSQGHWRLNEVREEISC
jgi:hypothetical protein